MKRVYILGSGFSTLSGAPTSRKVLPNLFNDRVMDQLTLDLKQYLSDFLFSGNDGWIENSNLEEILSRLDLIKIYQPYNNINYDKVSYFEEVLIKKFTTLLSPNRTIWNKPEYLAFREQLKLSDTIITFNYDLIIEEILTSLKMPYHYCLDNFKSVNTAIKLLKLHGSINQFYCPKCTKVTIANDEINSEFTFKIVCPNCHAKGEEVYLKQFIIAPTLFKTFSLPTLRDLWFKALTQLSSADEIIFIGYSLPEADILSYQLFDFSKKMASKQNSVYLVNGPQIEQQRFMDIYGNWLHNTRDYFEDWIRKGCPLAL